MDTLHVPGARGRVLGLHVGLDVLPRHRWDEATKRNGLWLFEGKQWNESVDTEFGNFDYLMGCDVHVTEPRVSEELDRWGQWYVETTGVDGCAWTPSSTWDRTSMPAG